MKSLHRAVFDLRVHLVLVTKYRKNILTPKILNRSQEIFTSLAKDWDIELIEFDGEADHVHLLLSLKPDIQPSKLVNNFKTVSSRLLRKEYGPHIAKFYKQSVLWSRSYCIISCGGVTVEKLKEYIEKQGMGN